MAKVLACQAAMQQSGVRFPPSPNWRLSHVEEVAKELMTKPSATDVKVLGGGGEGEGHKHCSESGKGEH